MRSNPVRITIVLPILCLTLLAGCARIMKPPPPTAETALVPIAGDALPSFADDLNYDGLADALTQSLTYLATLPPDKLFQYGPDRVSARQVIQSLTVFRAALKTRPSAAALNQFIRSKFRIYRSAGKEESGSVLFTGYYEPSLKGSRVRQGRYQYPVYGRPADLITVDLGRFREKYKGQRLVGRLAGDRLVPYYDRTQIDDHHALDGKAPILAWVADPVALFFLHIQGSGKIYFNDGGYINAYYRATNGHPYRSIGRLLIDEGAILKENMSMQAIRAYLEAHPGRIQEIFNTNPSYVFFVSRKDGPFGYLNVRLTAGRSLATDRRLFPPAALTLVETEKPVVDASGQISRWIPFSRFFLNQDTGGAIKGPFRVDLYCGDDQAAEQMAGVMQQRGRLFFFVPK